jgi:hypothetical protein
VNVRVRVNMFAIVAVLLGFGHDDLDVQFGGYSFHELAGKARRLLIRSLIDKEGDASIARDNNTNFHVSS